MAREDTWTKQRYTVIRATLTDSELQKDCFGVDMGMQHKMNR